MKATDLAITGEGRFDSQSLAGKVPSYLLQLADTAAVPLALVAGDIQAPVDVFIAAHSLTTIAGSSAAAIATPVPYLEEAGRELAGSCPSWSTPDRRPAHGDLTRR